MYNTVIEFAFSVILCVGSSFAMAFDNSTESAYITPSNPVRGPRAKFSTSVYDFGRTQAGEMVKYTFFFTNVGDQTLEISDVRTSCGCTAAGDWTRRVAPGQTGNVCIQFNSSNFSGHVLKSISINSNDKQTPETVLELKGVVWKPIEIVPPYTVINVAADASRAEASVRVINHTDDPLALFSPVCDMDPFTLAIMTNQPGKAYTLVLISTNELKAANVQGRGTIKTSWPKAPTIDIPFWVNVQPIISVIPQRIELPQLPLKVQARAAITIQNNSTNALILKDADINILGVDVQLREVQVGRLFTVVLTFPENFDAPVGQSIALTIKSNQPRMSKIQIPIVTEPPSVLSKRELDQLPPPPALVRRGQMGRGTR
jgi:hypothetical protein